MTRLFRRVVMEEQMWITGLESDASRKIILNALFRVATHPQVPDKEPRSSRDEEDLDGGPPRRDRLGEGG